MARPFVVKSKKWHPALVKTKLVTFWGMMKYDCYMPCHLCYQEVNFIFFRTLCMIPLATSCQGTCLCWSVQSIHTPTLERVNGGHFLQPSMSVVVHIKPLGEIMHSPTNSAVQCNPLITILMKPENPIVITDYRYISTDLAYLCAQGYRI